MAFLELKNLGKSYGAGSQRQTILRDIDLSIGEGEFVAIVGFSGAGKSTLLNMIAGLVTPDTGSVSLAGERITEPGPHLGLVFQNYSLLPWMTVAGNINLAVKQVFPQYSAKQRKEHVARYIDMVNLTPARDKYPKELSGGMRQRVSVARTLAIQPQVLLMDEPLSALDALTRAVLQDEILQIWERERRTVVLITNDVDEGILMADRIIPLTAGPGATLGPEFAIDLPRPRDRKAINSNDAFKKLRNSITAWLINEKRRQREAAASDLPVGSIAAEAPTLVPSDLTRRPRRSMLSAFAPSRG